MRVTRRKFLKGMGAAVGGFGLAASGDHDVLLSYDKQPEDVYPGVATWYATTCRECPAGCGMLVKNRDKHVIKCEGNPVYPINQGRLCARGQASLQGLYDPDRIPGPMRRAEDGSFEPAAWKDALDAIGRKLTGGARIALVSRLETGSLKALMRQWLAALGSDRLVVYEPIDYQSVKDIYGGVVPTFNIARSDYLLSFAADFLGTWISPVQFAREFMAMRKITDGARGHYVYVGPRVSMTAVNADRRLIVPAGSEEKVALAVISEMRGGPPRFSADRVGPELGLDPERIRYVARGLAAAGSPLALPGIYPSAARAAAVINNAVGSTLVDPSRPHALSDISPASEMDNLIADMRRGAVDVLVIYGADPVYSLPKAEHFVEGLKRVPLVISLSSYMDETAARADWILPPSTPLESWGDYEPYPGISGLVQPTMGTILDTRNVGDILIGLAKSAGTSAETAFGARDFYSYLRRRWGFPLTGLEGPDTVAPEWESNVQVGGKWPGAPPPAVRSIVPVDAAPSVTDGLAASPAGPILAPNGAPPPKIEPLGPAPGPPSAVTVSPVEAVTAPSQKKGIRLHAYPHIYYYDGRGANKRWLQEIPEPVTKTVWGTWAELHPSTARRLSISTDDVVEITHGDASVRIPAFVYPGVAPDTVAVPMGEGHKYYGRYARGVGENIFPLLSTLNPVVRVAKTGETKWVTRIKGDTDQRGREIVQTVELGTRFRRTKKLIMPLPEGYGFYDFYPGHRYKKHRWAMVVDLDRCIGCHACVVACYAENNVPIVGPEGIWSKREMSWLRIDRYTDWRDPAAPVLFQPMLCQHCDAAPCEPVCPVFAAAHNHEGINMQVYNRCVGTRDCSNNCPYKVRRFEWYNAEWPVPLNWQLNPDVTVRCRGVMEKCTFCIQRVRRAELVALREGRELRDGEVVPACVETCPTGVFTFGDLKDRDSAVAKLIYNEPRAYQILAELNTKTAVIYLKRITARA